MLFLRIGHTLALTLLVSFAFAQNPAPTPFPSWTAALQRAASGGENARVAFIGDSNLDQPRGFYLPLRLAFEGQAAGSPGSATGGAGAAALTGFLINELEIQRSSGWASLNNRRGLADPTLVSKVAGDELSVIGARAPSRFDRATVHFDRVPGGGSARVTFVNGAGAVLRTQTVDLSGLPAAGPVSVTFDGFTFADGNRVTVRTLDPRTGGVHLLGVVTDRKPNNSVQVHKLAYSGDNAKRWAARLATSALQDFWRGLDLAIVSLGTNDMRRGDREAYERFETGMSDILAYFRAAGVPVIVAAPADMAPDVSSFGPGRSFDEETTRITLRRLCATYGAAYYDLGKLHGDYAQILRDGIYRENDPIHYLAYSVNDPASLRHGPYFFSAIMGRPTEDRSAGNAAAPTPDGIATPEGCGPTVVREVDGSGTPAYVTFREPAPSYRVLAQIANDVALGEVRIHAYGEAGDATRTSPAGNTYGPRQLTIAPETNLAATLRLPATTTELAAVNVDQPNELRYVRVGSEVYCEDYAGNGQEQGLDAVLAIGGGHLLQFSVAGFGSFYQVAAQVPLPVELVSFGAEVAGGNVELRWSTASEAGFSHFVVERSRDAVTWEAVGEVLAKAESGGGADYGYTDREAPSQQTYYRLAMNDRDGSVARSAVVAVTRETNDTDGQTAITLAPNPATSVVNVRLGAPAAGQRLRVRDVHGRTVREQIVTTANESIDLRGITPGLYVVEATGVAGVVRLVVRLVVQ